MADKVVELDIVERADHVTVMRTLKSNCNYTTNSGNVFRRNKNGELIARMEDVLQVYYMRYNPKRTVVYFVYG